MTNDTRQRNDGRDLSPPPTEREVREAEMLRQALETQEPTEDVQLLRALRLAYDPSELPPLENEWLVASALRKSRKQKRQKVVVGATAAILSLAASIALAVGIESARPTLPQTKWHRSHSTQSLLVAIDKDTSTTDRIDIIERVRARDYRQNMFARMGVQ